MELEQYVTVVSTERTLFVRDLKALLQSTSLSYWKTGLMVAEGLKTRVFDSVRSMAEAVGVSHTTLNTALSWYRKYPTFEEVPTDATVREMIVQRFEDGVENTLSTKDEDYELRAVETIVCPTCDGSGRITKEVK